LKELIPKLKIVYLNLEFEINRAFEPEKWSWKHIEWE